MSTEKLQSLARDLHKMPPRSPRETLGGFVIGIHGEYNFYPCGLGGYFWKFTGLDHQKFQDFVATGATDAEVDAWRGRRALISTNHDQTTLDSIFDARPDLEEPRRARAGKERTANTLMAEYYVQRSNAGSIIAEATAISEPAFGFHQLGQPLTPGDFRIVFHDPLMGSDYANVSRPLEHDDGVARHDEWVIA